MTICAPPPRVILHKTLESLEVTKINLYAWYQILSSKVGKRKANWIGWVSLYKFRDKANEVKQGVESRDHKQNQAK